MLEMSQFEAVSDLICLVYKCMAGQAIASTACIGLSPARAAFVITCVHTKSNSVARIMACKTPPTCTRDSYQLALSHICMYMLVLYQLDDLFGYCVILGMFYCFQHI